MTAQKRCWVVLVDDKLYLHKNWGDMKAKVIGEFRAPPWDGRSCRHLSLHVAVHVAVHLVSPNLTLPYYPTAAARPVPLALAKIRIFDVDGKLELQVTFAGNTFPLRGEDPNENNLWRTALQIGMTHLKLTEKNIISMFSEVRQG